MTTGVTRSDLENKPYTPIAGATDAAQVANALSYIAYNLELIAKTLEVIQSSSDTSTAAFQQ